jgi:hypothetical protein
MAYIMTQPLSKIVLAVYQICLKMRDIVFTLQVSFAGLV